MIRQIVRGHIIVSPGTTRNSFNRATLSENKSIPIIHVVKEAIHDITIRWVVSITKNLGERHPVQLFTLCILRKGSLEVIEKFVESSKLQLVLVTNIGKPHTVERGVMLHRLVSVY